MVGKRGFVGPGDGEGSGPPSTGDGEVGVTGDDCVSTTETGKTSTDSQRANGWDKNPAICSLMDFFRAFTASLWIDNNEARVKAEKSSGSS
jgi:hypothetical protein